jgi:hypothetical protein
VEGVLVIPKWVSASFWPILYDNGKLPEGWKVLYEYVKPKNFFVNFDKSNRMFTKEPFSGNVLAIQICLK